MYHWSHRKFTSKNICASPPFSTIMAFSRPRSSWIQDKAMPPSAFNMCCKIVKMMDYKYCSMSKENPSLTPFQSDGSLDFSILVSNFCHV